MLSGGMCTIRVLKRAMSSSSCSRKVQISRQFRQSWIWRNPRLVDSSGACGNQLGIERIVLGASQMHSTERLDLDRLQHQHDEARCSQMLHHTAFVTARCFDSDTRHASIGQVCDQSAPAQQGTLETCQRSGCDRETAASSLALGCIDSSRRYDSLRHLPRPCLVKRTKLFRQPSGSDEGADDDHATRQPQTAQGGLDPIASGLPRGTSPRQAIPLGICR